MRILRRYARRRSAVEAWTVAGVLAVAAALAGCGSTRPAASDTPTTPPSATPTTTSPAPSSRPVPVTSSRPAPTPSTTAHFSLTDPASPWVVVNKLRPLAPRTYAPRDLVPVGGGQQMRAQAAAALKQLLTAAKAQNLVVTAASGYRSYSYQVGVYDRAVARLGKDQADLVSARPGYSEHQTGWTVDVAGGGCVIEDCFAATPQGKWVAANAYRWGFVVRYPPGAQAITGYQYEPWHLRFVGTQLAGDMHRRGVATLERWFGLASAPAYPGESVRSGERAEESPGG